MPIEVSSNWTKNDLDPNHVYLDINAVNNNSLTYQAIPLSFSQNRNETYLHNPSDYYASIIRFTIDTRNNIPVFIPSIMTPAQQLINFPAEPFNADITVYSFTLAYTVDNTVPKPVYNFSDQTFIYYIFSGLTAKKPTQYQQNSFYYHTGSYQTFVSMMNLALGDAMDSLILNASMATPPVTISYSPPFIQYDPITSLFTMYYPKMNTGIEEFQIYMNSPLQALLNSFSVIHLADLSANGRDFIFNISYNTVINNNMNSTGYNFFTQDQSSISSINPVDSIVFTTNLIPITQSYISPITPYTNINGGDTGLNNVGLNSNIIQSFVDYQVDFGPGNTYNGAVFYNPTAEYRLIDLNRVSSMNIIDFNVYWKDHFGNLFYVFLSPGAHVGIKILFRRKDYNNLK